MLTRTHVLPFLSFHTPLTLRCVLSFSFFVVVFCLQAGEAATVEDAASLTDNDLLCYIYAGMSHTVHGKWDVI